MPRAEAHKVSSFHPIISCFLDDHSSIYTLAIARAATLLSHPWCGDGVPAHLHLARTPRTLTPLCRQVHVRSHTLTWTPTHIPACTHAHTHTHAHKPTLSEEHWKYAAILRDDMGLDMLVMFSVMTTLKHTYLPLPLHLPHQGLVEERLVTV